MDRFVTRTPTWKTLHYKTVVAQWMKNSPVVTKAKTSHTFELQSAKNASQRSPQVLRLASAFSEQLVLTENCSANSSDGALSSASSISPPITIADTGKPLLLGNSSSVKKCRTPTKKHLGKLGDYVDCPEEKENDTCMILGQTQNYSGKVLQAKQQVEDNTSSKQLPQTPNPNKQLCPSVPTNLTTEKPQTPEQTPMFLTRIQKDLDSPSASVRVRALKALSSPTNSPYAHFDVPEDEQSLRFSNSQEEQDIKDVMRNVVIYVEVRSGKDDRSEGVRNFIKALGARVNLTFTRDTTHVVFKEGRLSTFKKAHLWHVPVVSILWVEACKTQNRICNPKDYPISNIDRYENPELYSKIKIFKYLQLGTESNKRKVKAPTTKDTTPAQKTVTLKNSTLISTTPSNSSTNHKKTDISQFFKKLDKTNKVLTAPKITENSAGATTNKTIESPASKLLNSIASDCYKPSQQSKAANRNSETKRKTTKNNDLKHDEESQEPISDINKTNKVKKALDFSQSERENGTHTELPATPTTRPRRRSVVATPVVAPNGSKDSTEDSIILRTQKVRKRRSTLPPEDTNSTESAGLPAKNTRRRRSVYTPKKTTIEVFKPDTQFENIEDISTLNANTDNSKQHLELAKDLEVANVLSNAVKAPTELSKFGRRRTIYSYKSMNESGKSAAIKTLDFTKQQRPTCYSLKPMETDTMASANSDIGDGIRGNEKTEIISKECAPLTSKQQSSELKTPTKQVVSFSNTRRRTLYTPKKLDVNKIVANSNSSQDESCLSPTASNMKGKVAASSTLIERADKLTTPVKIPSATLTSGKLLEETKECATPIPVFSSTKRPGNKRRTVFDVSMDIISQRVQCINQSARRSLVPSSADNLNDAKLKSLNSPGKKQKTIILPEPDSENSTPTNNDLAKPLVAVSSPAIQNRKRKLFVPNETLTPLPLATNRRVSLSASTGKTLNNSSAKTAEEKNVTKRRRTLMPFSQPSFSGTTSSSSEIGNKSKASSSVASSVKNRRSTLDFEETEKTRDKICITEEQPLTSEMELSKTSIKSKKKNIIVYTNMHKEQIDVIREAVSKLDDCELEDTVTDRTTHLISLEARRTLNLLRALVRGLWIVEYNWILDSKLAGELMPEEPYELQGFSRAIKMCRSERQAFGNKYKCDLFSDIGPFYVFLRCKPVKRNDLMDLIRLCGGRLSQYRNKARYIIGDPGVEVDDKMYLTCYWVLDCISQMKIMKIDKYLYPNSLPIAEPASSKQSSSSNS